MSDDRFLARWSRRKAQAQAPTPEAPAPAQAPAVAAQPQSQPATGTPVETAPLPPIESLTPDSDFTPFMRPGVDETLKRRALKMLLADPRFNVMDGLDVYIDDYSKPDPLPEGWLEKLNAVARLGDYKPPQVEALAKETSAQEQSVVPALPQEQEPVSPPHLPTREGANPE
jgi:Protein of unknown function (DUF3306)